MAEVINYQPQIILQNHSVSGNMALDFSKNHTYINQWNRIEDP